MEGASGDACREDPVEVERVRVAQFRETWWVLPRLVRTRPSVLSRSAFQRVREKDRKNRAGRAASNRRGRLPAPPLALSRAAFTGWGF